jgi:hypothetical protein
VSVLRRRLIDFALGWLYVVVLLATALVMWAGIIHIIEDGFITLLQLLLP